MLQQISEQDKLICLTDNEHSFSAVNPPIYQSSIFSFNTIEDYIDYKDKLNQAYCYTRGNNPSCKILEQKLAALDQAEQCRVFSSGMGAISAALFSTLNSGDHVLVLNTIYGPTLDYLKFMERYGISFDVYSLVEISQLEQLTKANTKVIYTESPATMTFETIDLQKLAQFAKARNIVTIIDNTCLTPLLQKPLSLGIDIAVYSLSKYTGGHSDVIAGAVVTSQKLMINIDKYGYKLSGSVLSPNDAFLLLRGLRTLPLRLEALSQTTTLVIDYLSKHPQIKAIYHPLSYSPEQRDIYQNQTNGYAGLFSIQLVNNHTHEIRSFINHLQTFNIAVSWGGFESLVMVKDINELRKPISDNVIIRFSLGLLDAKTIIQDLEQALNQIGTNHA
ncbi:MAG: PLP-dependent transferase [Neisseriaceae bacterium]|nr:MAG: PLP-dependent transferase [Neisseriaceae bacterium]